MKKVRVKVKDSGIYKFKYPCLILRTDCLIKHATDRETEGRIEEEDVSAYWMTSKKREDNVN
jgi:hypothetical protein